MPTHRLPDRLTPLATRKGVRALYGDIHNHCNLSYGHGSLRYALENAKRQLDFVSITGHAYWPDMPVDEPSVAHIVDFHVKGFARLEKLWPEHFDTLAAFDEPSAFTVFPGYEMHSCEHGDYTIVLRDLDQRQIVKADTPTGLQERLRKAYGARAFAFPHHIGYRQGARGINWNSFIAALSPVLEMISMHGCSETSLTDRPFLHSMGPSDGTNTVHAGLNAGHVFGVLGNTDHHSGYPGSYGHGRSAVYASENSRATIWDAFHARHTNALTGDNCHLFMALGEAMQGDLISQTENAEVAIEVVGGSFIDCIDVIKNGSIIERITPAVCGRPIDVSGDVMETLLVLELGWGSRGSYHDWQGVLSLDGGEILAVEPRLRGPEVVSPLESEGQMERPDSIELYQNAIRFDIRAFANPNNATATTQTLAARVRIRPDATFRCEFDGHKVEISADRLIGGALAGNLGPIDSPAFRFHPLPHPRDWQWHGQILVGSLKPGDWLITRLRQSNRQWAWTSPILCR